MLRAPLVTILAREMRLKFFEVDQRLEMLRVALITILAREMRLKVFSSRASFGGVMSAAGHDIGWRKAIESYFNYIWCQTANNVTSRARKISLKFVEKMSIFNRIYRANIVTSGPRRWAPPRLVLLKNFQSHFSRQLCDLRHSHHTISEDCMFQSHTPHQYRGKSVLARNRM